MTDNTRACGLCRHLDSRQLESGFAQCWKYYTLRKPSEVVPACTGAERADGNAPPGQLWFTGGQKRG